MTRFRLSHFAALLLLPLVVACGPARLPQAGMIDDPTEETNRAIHNFNVGVDRALLRPASVAYGTVLPDPVRQSVGNFASNLDQPRYVVNDLLQLRLDDAVQNTFRFLVNSTFGIGGLFDPATDMGLFAEETDFGETMHIWGVEEGAYMVLPVLGPSTSRDTAGWIVDRVMNPVRLAVPSEDGGYLTALTVSEGLDARYRYLETVDGLYYDSADSYAQARLIYLQNRRYELRGDAPIEDQYFDPYSDPAADPYLDPYDDPYFDPYEALDAN